MHKWTRQTGQIVKFFMYRRVLSSATHPCNWQDELSFTGDSGKWSQAIPKCAVFRAAPSFEVLSSMRTHWIVEGLVVFCVDVVALDRVTLPSLVVKVLTDVDGDKIFFGDEGYNFLEFKIIIFLVNLQKS